MSGYYEKRRYNSFAIAARWRRAKPRTAVLTKICRTKWLFSQSKIDAQSLADSRFSLWHHCKYRNMDAIRLISCHSSWHSSTGMSSHPASRGSSTDTGGGGGVAPAHRDSIQDHVLNYITASYYRPCLSSPGAVTQTFRDSPANFVVQWQLASTQFVVCSDIIVQYYQMRPSTPSHLMHWQPNQMQHVKSATHDAGNLLRITTTTDGDVGQVSHASLELTYFSDYNTISCWLI